MKKGGLIYQIIMYDANLHLNAGLAILKLFINYLPVFSKYKIANIFDYNDTNLSIGIQVHIKFLSPYASCKRDTVGQYLFSKLYSEGKAAFSLE